MTRRQKLISHIFRFRITVYIYPGIIAIFALQIYKSYFIKIYLLCPADGTKTPVENLYKCARL